MVGSSSLLGTASKNASDKETDILQKQLADVSTEGQKGHEQFLLKSIYSSGRNFDRFHQKISVFPLFEKVRIVHI
jgi:hypothetical protein